MDQKEEVISIQLLGRTYPIKCLSSQCESLVAAAKRVEEEMRAVQAHGKVVGTDHITVMAALRIAYELILLQTQNDQERDTINKKLQELQNKIELALII